MKFLSWLIVRKAWQAYEKVIAALVNYYESGRQEKSSELTFVRWKTLRDGGLPIADIVRSEVSMAVGLHFNTVPANFWVLFGLYPRPELLEEVRQEVAQKALYTADNVRILHISTLRDDCPILPSVFQKTLRTRTSSSPSRFVPDDFLLAGQHSLRTGSVISMPGASVGRYSWGSMAGEFNPRRFLTTNENAHRLGGFVMFGASPILCPGRHFASAEILAVAAMTVLQYDLTPMDGVWNVPKINTMAITSVMQPPKGGAYSIEIRRGPSDFGPARYRSTSINTVNPSGDLSDPPTPAQHLTMSRIGWYGLGSMGLAMATNLQKHLASRSGSALQNLIYSNRTMARGDALKQLGATPESSFQNLVAQCGIIFTMVSNDKVLTSLIDAALASGHALHDKIFVDCSTVHPTTVGLTVARLQAQNASFLAAPVFGGNPIAVDGKLVFAIAGPKKASDAVKPLIQGVMGRKVIDCGEDATKSSLLKIAGNIVTVNMMEAVGEAQVFAERTGLGTGPMEELIGEAFGPVAGGYSKRLTSGVYAPPLGSRPGFGVSLAIKDADHAFAMAKEHNVELPGLQVARDNMAAAREYAGECLDSSSMYGILRQKAGMEFWNEKSRQGGK
ncbi:hypothetical protein HFD88_006395 [Aspergillus terreus]|nr:hypothetical protein HFD88_006395 [Aspergillus terreus]